MDIASSCPACGAQMMIPSDARQVSCPFCGMRYDVDVSGVEPVLRVATASNEMPDVPPIPEPVEPPAFPQYIPAQPQPQTTKPAGGVFTSERVPPAIRRQPIWVIITIIVGLLLCLVFGCMAAVFVLTRTILGG